MRYSLLTPFDPQRLKYTQTSQVLVPTGTPIESCVIHRLELPIQVQDLIKAYQTSTRFCDVYHYITDGKLPSGAKAQACIWAEALNHVVINNFLFRIDTHRDKD